MKRKTFDYIKELSFALDKIKLIESFARIRQHYDEPKFWFYSATISDRYLKHDGSHFHSNASGVSFFSQKSAVIKVLAEAIERYCNFAFFEKNVDFVGGYSAIKDEAINPEQFIFFTKEQLQRESYKKFQVKDESIFRWTSVKSLSTNKDHLVPCQAIYLSYTHIKGEPVIYPSISTGVAAHTDFSSAILGGIYEIIERDSFMIFYLKKLKPKKFDLKSSRNEKIRKLIDIANRYKMELYSVDITTDLGIPAVASIVIDRSGLSKAVSVGLKADFNVVKAIIGSINEAFHTRSWIRESYIQNPTIVTEKKLIKDSSMKNRGLLWYQTKSISRLDFLFKNLKVKKVVSKNKKMSVQEQILILKDTLAKKGYSIYYKDITADHIKSTQFKVAKVIIPGMQPVYLDEQFPSWGGDRLQSVPIALGYKNNIEVNTYPHPFL